MASTKTIQCRCYAVGLALLGCLSVQAQTNFATLTTDGAWTWYNDHRALFHNGKLYFGFVRSGDGKSALSVFDLATGRATNLWASGFTQLDDHNLHDRGFLQPRQAEPPGQARHGLRAAWRPIRSRHCRLVGGRPLRRGERRSRRNRRVHRFPLGLRAASFSDSTRG